MDLKKLDKFMPVLVITLGIIVISMVIIGLTNRIYYDLLKPLIIGVSIITLIACFIGYKINKKYLKSPE